MSYLEVQQEYYSNTRIQKDSFSILLPCPRINKDQTLSEPYHCQLKLGSELVLGLIQEVELEWVLESLGGSLMVEVVEEGVNLLSLTLRKCKLEVYWYKLWEENYQGFFYVSSVFCFHL